MGRGKSPEGSTMRIRLKKSKTRRETLGYSQRLAIDRLSEVLDGMIGDKDISKFVGLDSILLKGASEAIEKVVAQLMESYRDCIDPPTE